MIVVDTSVAGKWFITQEKESEKSISLLLKHTTGIQTIIVPELLFYEIANALVTKGIISLWKITNALTKLYSTDLQIYRPTERDLKNAARLAKRYKTSVYDMIYAVIAKKCKTELITADEKFANATKFKFVRLLKDLS